MEKTKLTIDEIAEINPEAMLADGFDDAIMGMCMQFGAEPLVAYDYEKCIEILKYLIAFYISSTRIVWCKLHIFLVERLKVKYLHRPNVGF